ncbi:MAG: DUF3068 domain-containing protein [Jatrophihabitantaceae bacterium]
MRKAAAAVLVGFGVFCLVLAGMLRFYAPGAAEKTPLNTDAMSVATGPATLYNPSTGQATNFEAKATRHLRADSAASNSNVIVFEESLCTVKVIGPTPECVDARDPQGRLLSFTTDRVADNRTTAMAVNDPKYNENVDGNTNVKHIGLSYKFPFNAEKKSYPFFDTDTNTVATAKYQGESSLEGLTVYKFVATIPPTSAMISPGLPGLFSNTRTVWIEPTTGVIVKGVEHQLRTLPDGKKVLDLTLTFDQATVRSQAKLADDGRSKIQLLTVIVPIIALVLGIIALLAAWLVARRNSAAVGRRRAEDRTPPPDWEPNWPGASSDAPEAGGEATAPTERVPNREDPYDEQAHGADPSRGEQPVEDPYRGGPAEGSSQT